MDNGEQQPERMESTVYRFRDSHGREGRLILEPEERSRLRAHVRSDQAIAVFVVRNTGPGRYLLIMPHVSFEVGEGSRTVAHVGLTTGGSAEVTPETYAAFVADVENDRPGDYDAEHIQA
jgi:hypothetical protein